MALSRKCAADQGLAAAAQKRPQDWLQEPQDWLQDWYGKMLRLR
jgi:hypothetical protein